jgi:glycosyltransferase involved in cell wall biosynthesis
MGGIEKTLLSCLPLLSQNGIYIDVLCSSGGTLENDYTAQGTSIIHTGKSHNVIIDTLFLYKILRKCKYDIVHSRQGFGSGFFAVICKLYKIPFLVSVHSDRPQSFNSWENKIFLNILRNQYMKLQKYLTIKYAAKIIGHSKNNLGYFSKDWKNEQEKYAILYNGIDFQKFNPIISLEKNSLELFVEEAKKVIIHIGSFKKEKNHDFLIDVFNLLCPIENSYKLILVGAGNLIEDIKEKVKDLGLEKNVYFAGLENNIAPYLFYSTIFFFPSLFEGFGNVLIEAQYMKVPVCASNISSHYESCFIGYHGFFFNPEDKLSAKEQLERMIDSCDKHTLDKTIEEAYSFSKQFSIESMVNRLINIYRECL